MVNTRRDTLGIIASGCIMLSGCSALSNPTERTSTDASEADILLQNFSGLTVTGQIEARVIDADTKLLNDEFVLEDREQVKFQNPIKDGSHSVEVTVTLKSGPRSTFGWDAPINEDTILSIAINEDDIEGQLITG